MKRVRVILATLAILTLVGFSSCKKEEAPKAPEAAAPAAQQPDAAPAAQQPAAAPAAAPAAEGSVTVKNFIALLDLIVEASKIEDCAKAVEAVKAIPQSAIDSAKADVAGSSPDAEPAEADKKIIEERMGALVAKSAACPDFIAAASGILDSLNPEP